MTGHLEPSSGLAALDAFPAVRRATDAPVTPPLGSSQPQLAETDYIEREKTKWMEPVPTEEVEKLKKEKKSALEVDRYRFDFQGELLSYPSTSGTIELKDEEEIARKNELFHHGDDPALAGYTMAELMRLSRSTVPGQRRSALRAISRIIERAKSFKYEIPTHQGTPLTIFHDSNRARLRSV
jgi:hypothetical protein